jgi:hypothetical protein
VADHTSPRPARIRMALGGTQATIGHCGRSWPLPPYDDCEQVHKVTSADLIGGRRGARSATGASASAEGANTLKPHSAWMSPERPGQNAACENNAVSLERGTRWILMPARRLKQHRAQVLPAVNWAWLSRNCRHPPRSSHQGDAARLANCLSRVGWDYRRTPLSRPWRSRDWVNAALRSRGLGPLGGGLPIPARSRAGCRPRT